MRAATVVLPVPGLPVKDMCRVGGWATSPTSRRSLSTSSSAAISRMRRLTGFRPTSSRSSCSRTGPTPEASKLAPMSIVAGVTMSAIG